MEASDYQPFEDYQKNIENEKRCSPSAFASLPARLRPESEMPTASGIAKLGGFRREYVARTNQNHQSATLMEWIQSDVNALMAFVEDAATADVLWGVLRSPSPDNREAKAEDDATSEHKLSTCQTCITIFKAFIAVGIFFIPKSMAEAGWAASLILLTIAGVVSTMGMLALSDCFGQVKKSYAGMGREAFGRVGYCVVAFQIASSQLLFTSTAFIFEVTTLQSVLLNVGVEAASMPPTWLLFLAAIVVKYPLGLLRRLKSMWFVALISSFLVLMSVISISFLALRELQARDFQAHPTVTLIKTDGALAYMGTAVYIFEAISLIIPIRAQMAEPERFGVVLCGMVVFIGILLGGFSLLTYWTWGDDLEPIVLNQPFGDAVGFMDVLKCVCVISSLLNFPFAMYPTFSITESAIFARWNKDAPSCARTWAKNTWRAILTFTAAFIAYTCASVLQLLVSFLGVLACVPLALWIPGGIHLKLVRELTCWQLSQDWLIVFVGLAITPLICYTDITALLKTNP
eukprot:TRINITY_DN63395_c0_g1_i1.p1 TRINITY_DN63395_c0_g1~~TRINITY_DN63395_c0_g1_i1.p1  ORF type:complete len:542 (+),score=83.18 TRINITY_DN63395_c0_g1_i1:76-1626(+)